MVDAGSPQRPRAIIVAVSARRADARVTKAERPREVVRRVDVEEQPALQIERRDLVRTDLPDPDRAKQVLDLQAARLDAAADLAGEAPA